MINTEVGHDSRSFAARAARLAGDATSATSNAADFLTPQAPPIPSGGGYPVGSYQLTRAHLDVLNSAVHTGYLTEAEYRRQLGLRRALPTSSRTLSGWTAALGTTSEGEGDIRTRHNANLSQAMCGVRDTSSADQALQRQAHTAIGTDTGGASTTGQSEWDQPDIQTNRHGGLHEPPLGDVRDFLDSQIYVEVQEEHWHPDKGV
jgi:hypothetical protein